LHWARKKQIARFRNVIGDFEKRRGSTGAAAIRRKRAHFLVQRLVLGICRKKAAPEPPRRKERN